MMIRRICSRFLRVGATAIAVAAPVLFVSTQPARGQSKPSATSASVAASPKPRPPSAAPGGAKPKSNATNPTAGSGAARKNEATSPVIRAREAQIAELINDPPVAAPVGGNNNINGAAPGASSVASPKPAGDPNDPVVVTTSRSEVTALDQLDLEALELYAQWLTSPDVTAAPKESDLDAFMSRSRTFLKRRPDEQRPWLLRARIALRTNRVAEGLEAAENLKRLGAVASPDDKTRRMMLALNLKGWLQSDAPPNAELSRALAAAELGDAKAQALLGQMFATGGSGVPKDSAEALRWLLKAADGGDADGQLSLALMYRNGTGVPKDETQALTWSRKAARQGNAAAQDMLKQRSLSW